MGKTLETAGSNAQDRSYYYSIPTKIKRHGKMAVVLIFGDGQTPSHVSNRRKPGGATAFGLVCVHRERAWIEAAGMADVVLATANRAAQPGVYHFDHERLVHGDRWM